MKEPGRARPRIAGDIMIYTVECSFADPAGEATWNDFYSLEKLPALISVGGFHTSQRFKALNAGCPVYLAMHSIDGPEVLAGDEYRRKGGGNFARWQQHIVDWHRNLYRGLDRVPAVGENQRLVLSAAGPDPLLRMGLVPRGMQAAALDKFPEHRWLAVLDKPLDIGTEPLPEGVDLYAPMTEQLTPGLHAAPRISRQ